MSLIQNYLPAYKISVKIINEKENKTDSDDRNFESIQLSNRKYFLFIRTCVSQPDKFEIFDQFFFF
jgi:hypothetical protein